MKKDKNELKNEKIKMNEYKNELEKEFKILKNNLNDLINESIYNLDIYNKIYNNLINNSEDLNNYENIMNILDFRCKKLLIDINNFINEKNKYKYIINLINLYEKIRNEITLIYKINNGDKKVKLFGQDFIKNNKNNCYLLINNKKI